MSSNSNSKEDAKYTSSSSNKNGRVLRFLDRRSRTNRSLSESAASAYFSRVELVKLHKQFRRISKNGLLDQAGFRESLGILGMVQDSLLCQRLFSVFNASKTGSLDFGEFAGGLGVLMKGSVDEKLDFAFAMTDIDGSGEITFEELLLTAESIMRIYSGIMGANSGDAIDETKVREMFDRLDRNSDGTVTREEYKRGMKKHPEFVASLHGSDIFESARRKKVADAERKKKMFNRMVDRMRSDVDRAIRLAESAEKKETFIDQQDTDVDEDEDDDELAIDDDVEKKTSELTEIQRLLTRVSTALELVVDGVETTKHQEIKKRLNRQTSELKLTSSSSSRQKSSRSSLVDVSEEKSPSSAAAKKKKKTKSLSGDGSLYFATREETTGTRGSSAFSASGALAPDDDAHVDDASNSKLSRFLQPASKGSTVFFGHQNWDLVLNVMKGIQMAVGRSAAEAQRPISTFDFHVKEKYTLVAGHHYTSRKSSEAVEKSVRFVDYAPFAFSKLRRHFGIDDDRYVHSIGPGNMLSNLMLGSLSSLAELGTEGKSGSFFYFTSDGMYMVKTIRKDEHKLFRKILPQYYYHMTRPSGSDADPNPDSLLTRIVGCHVVRLSKHSKVGANKIYFVVMTNMLRTEVDLHRRFDLKGSWVGRRTQNVESAIENQKTLKDLDFKDLGEKIRVGPANKARLLRSLEYDATFLERHALIDYSVLVGVHDKKPVVKKKNAPAEGSSAPEKHSSFASDGYFASSSNILDSNALQGEGFGRVPYFQKCHGGMESTDGRRVYVLGVIDFLTQYSNRKVAERVLKACACMDPNGISVAPPKKYKKRFVAFMSDCLE